MGQANQKILKPNGTALAKKLREIESEVVVGVWWGFANARAHHPHNKTKNTFWISTSRLPLAQFARNESSHCQLANAYWTIAANNIPFIIITYYYDFYTNGWHADATQVKVMAFKFKFYFQSDANRLERCPRQKRQPQQQYQRQRQQQR